MEGAQVGWEGMTGFESADKGGDRQTRLRHRVVAGSTAVGW